MEDDLSVDKHAIFVRGIFSEAWGKAYTEPIRLRTLSSAHKTCDTSSCTFDAGHDT
jgi:hypothetical protein